MQKSQLIQGVIYNYINKHFDPVLKTWTLERCREQIKKTEGEQLEYDRYSFMTTGTYLTLLENIKKLGLRGEQWEGSKLFKLIADRIVTKLKIELIF